jgi:hypothetical protein
MDFIQLILLDDRLPDITPVTSVDAASDFRTSYL